MIADVQTPGTLYKLVTIEQVEKLVQSLRSKPLPIALDLETTGLNHRTEKIVTVQFGTLNRVYILDVRPYYTLSPEVKGSWCKVIQGLLEACTYIVGQNIKFDSKFLSHTFDAHMLHVVDTMLQELIIHGVGLGHAENEGVAVDMASTAKRYGLEVHKEERSWFIGLDKREEWNLPLPEAQLAYIMQDIVIPLSVHSMQSVILEEKGLTQTATLENAVLPAIAQLEVDGSYIDRDKWVLILERKAQERVELEKEIVRTLTPIVHEHRTRVYTQESQAFKTWEEDMYAYLKLLEQEYCTYVPSEASKGVTPLTWGKYKIAMLREWKIENPRPKNPKEDTSPINLGSSTQLQIALEGIGVYVPSTDANHLAPYAKVEPLVGKILAWKKLDKFLNAFGENLLRKIESDGRIHPTYNQIGAATGRMSCSSPNWQQLPSHEPEETSIRRCVVGEPGNVLLTADFSNIELRILAEISQDATMLRLFAEGKDLHSMTARIMFGLSDDVDPKKAELKPGLSYRSVAKTINFGLVYGMSPVKLGATLGVPKEDAEKLFKAYFDAYPGVALWLETSSQTALENGYSLTIGGRKRFYRMTQEPTYDRERMTWEQYQATRSFYFRMTGRYGRQAKNAPIQGTNADILKYALILLHKHKPAYMKFVACVHDEIVLECPEEKATACSTLLSRCMTKACKIYLKTVTIPEVEVEVETYWKKG